MAIIYGQIFLNVTFSLVFSTWYNVLWLATDKLLQYVHCSHSDKTLEFLEKK